MKVKSTVFAAVLLVAACGGDSLAEAAGRRLTVDDAASLIAAHSRIPGDTQVVRVVAELWVDYMLLGDRVFADTTLGSLNVESITRQPLEEGMLAQLSNAVVEVDTVVSDAEIAERFASEMPGARATASQILLLFPQGASALQRDSVLVVARELHGRIVGGEDFSRLAERFSGDPGSASRGGSMGTFGRGQMLEPIDQAVFGMQPGDVSEPVRTDLGYHLLRLDQLTAPELSDVGDALRRRIQLERRAEAEAAYIGTLDESAGIELVAEALTVARALAAAPPSRLSGGAAERPLLTYEGGAYTVGELTTLIRNSPATFTEGIAAATDDDLEAALLRIGRQELLVEEARARGFEPTAETRDSVAAEARKAIRDRARVIGLTPDAAAADSTTAQAPDTVAALVRGALTRIVSGQQEILPLGGITFLLRDQGRWRIDESRIKATAERFEEIESP